MQKTIKHKFPSTRYYGSKRKLVDWIWGKLESLEFHNALDIMGGTGCISYLFKSKGKEVHYNDILKFNQTIGLALIENNKTKVTYDDIDSILSSKHNNDHVLIQNSFDGIYFSKEENKWLDQIIPNILEIKNKYKKAILFSALYQSCLSKRPFNLFHRANLNLRTNMKIKRSFGNHTTWSKPFPEFFRSFVSEINDAIFENGRFNKVVGGFDSLKSPNGFDLVYIDPPYFRNDSNRAINYLEYYHFLELITDYFFWEKNEKFLRGSLKRIPDSDSINNFTIKSNVLNSLNTIIDNHKKSKIIISYMSDAYPHEDVLTHMLNNVGKNVEIFRKPYNYALSKKDRKELLFIAY